MKISLISVAYEVIDFGLLLTLIMEGNANLQIAFTENKDEGFFPLIQFHRPSKSKGSVAL